MIEFLNFDLVYRRMNNGEVPQDVTIFTCLNLLKDHQNEMVKEIKKFEKLPKDLKEIREIQKAISEKANNILKNQEK